MKGEGGSGRGGGGEGDTRNRGRNWKDATTTKVTQNSQGGGGLVGWQEWRAPPTQLPPEASWWFPRGDLRARGTAGGGEGALAPPDNNGVHGFAKAGHGLGVGRGGEEGATPALSSGG